MLNTTEKIPIVCEENRVANLKILTRNPIKIIKTVPSIS